MCVCVQGLFRKILARKIRASHLVKMSTDELASKELARWRKMENKHVSGACCAWRVFLICFPGRVVLHTQKLRSPVLRTQACQNQNTATRALSTASNLFPVLISVLCDIHLHCY